MRCALIEPGQQAHGVEHVATSVKLDHIFCEGLQADRAFRVVGERSGGHVELRLRTKRGYIGYALVETLNFCSRLSLSLIRQTNLLCLEDPGEAIHLSAAFRQGCSAVFYPVRTSVAHVRLKFYHQYRTDAGLN
jgi:hypothetical protein